ncbi:hypothetical protein [Paenibacillus terrigena]|uniref:hypothetical protein n=1 Tax=Paenibacillus terrigena TaxID=369333 RepID=UPI0028D0F021|nr:hypothetical protein [Paenibacillus terrigena]
MLLIMTLGSIDNTGYRAKFLVLNTDKRIYEIATEVGFLKRDTFYKRFNEYTGKSASGIRSESELK